MRLIRKIISIFVVGCCSTLSAFGQSVHLSQFYNAPQLITPANTGLMPDHDFRLGLNYRNQWSALPVPYNTFSGWGDLKIGGNKDNDHNNWLGLGLTVYTDKAGDGHLALNQFQGNIAYHLQTSNTFMLSVGLSAANVTRSVDFNRLTYDAQWNGTAFNADLASGEQSTGLVRSKYMTVGAGVNFSYFPNENVYLKLGGAVMNVNKPIETLLDNNENQIGIRPIGTLDVTVRASELVILNPSVYFTTQNGARELVPGMQLRTVISGTARNTTPIELFAGGYLRLNDAAIFLLGVQAGPVQVAMSYDMTVSSLSPYNASYGAMEISLIFQGSYGKNRENLTRSYTCPRFN